MALGLFNRLWGPQPTPTIKVERKSDEIVPYDESVANEAYEAEDMQEHQGGRETPNHTDWEGFGDEEPLTNAVIPTESAERRKKKKKKKRKKTKPKADGHAAEEMEVDTTQLDSSPKASSSFDSVAQHTTNGQLQAPSTSKGSIGGTLATANSSGTAYGISTKKRRSPTSKAVVPSHENDEDSAASREASQESNALLNDGRRKDLNQPMTGSLEDNRDSSGMTSLLIAPVEPDTIGTSPAFAPQIPRDVSSASFSAGYNDDDIEQGKPKGPSRKALGKRKAIDEPVVDSTRKKPRRRKDKGQGQDLREFGFLPSDEASYSRPRSVTSDLYPSLLADLAGKVWEENIHITQDSEMPSNSRTGLRSPQSSWNAINKSGDPDEAAACQPLFVPNKESTTSLQPEVYASNASGTKHSQPVVEIRPTASTPGAKARPTPSKLRSTTPKTPKAKAVEIGAVPTSKGKLSTSDLGALIAAVESYKINQDLSDFQLNDRIHADAKDKFASQMWKEICEEVSYIPRRMIMNTCRRKYYNFNRGPWNDDEDDELKILHEKHPGKWKIIGEIMNRFSEDVRDRWRNYLVCGDTKKTSSWELEEELRLRSAVEQCVDDTREQSRYGSSQISNEESFIDWGKVSVLMDRTRSRIQCRDKWMKLKNREDAAADDPGAKTPISETWRMNDAAVEARLFSARDKLTLLRAIRDSRAAREGKIPWLALRRELDGEGKRMAWKYCFRKLIEAVPNQELEFTDMVIYLVDAFEKAAPNEPNGFDLPIEVFSTSKTNEKKNERRRHRREMEDNGERPSSSKKRKTLRRIQEQEESGTHSEATPAPSTRKATFRDRMQKGDDSQETPIGHGRSTNADIVADVTQGFESIKRTPKSGRKYAIRKSKRNLYLSEEKVIEDLSDDEPHASGINEDEMDLDGEEYGNATGDLAAEQDDLSDVNNPDIAHPYFSDFQDDNNEAGNPVRPETENFSDLRGAENSYRSPDTPDDSEFDEEFDLRVRDTQVKSPEESENEGDFNLHELRNTKVKSLEESESEDDIYLRTAQNVEGSPDLDAPQPGSSFQLRIGSPNRRNGFYDEENELVSSDYEDMSDIPAVKLPNELRAAREASIEL